MAVGASRPAELDASVVIATRDRPASVRLVLTDLCAQFGSRRFEVIVVDDGSDPPLAIDQAPLNMPVTLLRGRGTGPARARNLGWRTARADVVLFTDDDVRVSNTWLDSACCAFGADSNVVAVEGRVDTRTYDWLFEYSVAADRGGTGLTCNIGYRRSVLERLGGFDEEFPHPACEDQDLVNRAEALGTVTFNSEMTVEHLPRPVGMSDFARRGKFADSELRLIRKHRDRYSKSMPFWLIPLFYHCRHWAYVAYRERGRLITEPTRGKRWLLGASTELFAVCFALLRACVAGLTRRSAPPSA